MPRAIDLLRAGMIACAPALFLSACAEPLARSDALWPHSGDAVAANRIAHTIDPWPRASADTAFPTNGARVAESIVRYKTSKAPEAIAPPVLVTR